MKNLFLSVVLLLTVSFAFAANDVEKTSTNDVEKTSTIEKSIDVLEVSDFEVLKIELTEIGDLKTFLEENEGEFNCVDLYYNGSWVGWVCGNTVGDMIDSILALFF
ncbi:MAG TPA: hypothetical protein EYG92_11480 [Lutibacter sp.]|nr:hypothetical protein [Lutibacter sp.]